MSGNHFGRRRRRPPLPPPPLDESRRLDVAIVGGGYTGLSAALHLAEGGASVAVLDAGEPGGAASGLNGGQVNPGLKQDPAPLEVLDRATTAELLGTDRYLGAGLDRRAGGIQPLSYSRGRARAAMAKGASIFGDTRAVAIDKRNGCFRVTTGGGPSIEAPLAQTPAFSAGSTTVRCQFFHQRRRELVGESFGAQHLLQAALRHHLQIPADRLHIDAQLSGNLLLSPTAKPHPNDFDDSGGVTAERSRKGGKGSENIRPAG